MKRKTVYFFGIAILFLCCLVFFRHSFMVMATKSFLNKTFPQNYSVQDISAKNDRIHIYGLHAQKEQMEVTLDGLEFNIDWKEMLKSPLSIWNLKRKGFPNWTEAFFSMKQYNMDFKVQSGILQLEDQRYYFQLKPGEKKHEVGTLLVFHDPALIDHPFLVLQLHMRGDQLICQVMIEEVPSERLFQLAAFVFPESISELSGAKGDVQMRASVIFERDGSVDEISTRFHCNDFEIHHARNQVAVRMDKLSGDLNYPEGIEDLELPVWKKMQCGLNLENGTLLFGPNLAIAELEGNLSLDPRVDPAMTIRGEVLGQEKPLALQLVGKGAVHEDHAYWLEFGLNLDDHAGVMCDAFLSICRPELESLVVQVEANHLLPQQVEMLKGYFAKSLPRLKDWEVKEGSFGGKLVALFDHNELSHFEIQNLQGSNVALGSGDELYTFANLKGDGRLFDELNFEAELPVAHLFTFLSPELKDIFASYRPDDIAHISSKISFEKEKTITSASIEFLDLQESLQVGFESNRAFPSSLEEIKGGWARSQKLSHLLYGPFVFLANDNLKLYGDVDFVASYDGKEIELSLQVDDFLSKHPFIDIKAKTIGKKDVTEGRAKITYNPHTNHFTGLLPLVNADVYDRRYGLVLDQVDADITFDPKSVIGHLTHADVSFDDQHLLKKTQCDFVISENTKLTNFKTLLALDTDREYWIEAKHFDRESCNFRMLDEAKELVKFEGNFDQHWQGALSLASLTDPLTIQFNWDLISNTSLLYAENKTLSFLCKKEGGNYTLEKFISSDFSCNAAFSFSNKKLCVSEVEIKKNEIVAFKTAGDFTIALPTLEHDLKIESDLNIECNLLRPAAVNLTTELPVQFAFTPEKGFIFTDVKFKGKGCSLSFPSLEYDQQSLVTKPCVFHISEDLLGKFFDAGFLPAILSDFTLCKGLNGELALTSVNNQLSLEGFVDAKAKQYPIDFTWKDSHAKLAIGKKDQLAFEGAYGEDGFYIESIKGSFNNITADLKRLGNKQLKGSIALNLASFPDLFDIPLNQYLSKWKSGSGYRFEGIFTPREHLSDWGFKGKLKGDRFECAGYQLRSIEAKLQVEPGQISFENLDLTDDAGKMWIGEGALMRSGSEWLFSFPIVEIRSFQPSFLRKLAGLEKEISPLVIKTATIADLRGSLDNPSSITGAGNLRFINQIKNGEKRLLKHLPVEVLQQIGVKGESFIPASGEMDYTIQNGRLYLRETKGMVSDQNLSEFIPPRSGVMGYLDFAGNLFIDLQVHQKGNRQNTAYHSLKVRGTWEDPKVIIK